MNPPPAPAPPKVIRAKAAFDGASEQLRGTTEILVIDGRIAEIDGEVSRPDGVEITDLGPRTLSPGFIDCHIHSQLTPTRLLSPFLTESSALKTLHALSGLRDMLHAGFTTVRDCASLDEDFSTVDLKKAIELGLIEGPRMLVAPHMLGGTSGHAETAILDPHFHIPAVGVVDGVDAIRATVRREILFGADWIKVSLSGFFGFRIGDGPEEMTWSQDELDAAVAAASDIGIDTCVHALGDESVKRAVRAGARSIEHGSLASVEALKMLEDAGAFLVPTMMPVELFLTGQIVDVSKTPDPDAPPPPRPDIGLFRHDDELLEVMARIASSNCTIALGSDAGGKPHGDSWQEFRAMVRYGISPLRAMRAGTSVAAELLRREELGKLEVGKIADIVAMDGSPIDDIEATGRVEFVMKEGTVVRRPDGAQG